MAEDTTAISMTKYLIRCKIL